MNVNVEYESHFGNGTIRETEVGGRSGCGLDIRISRAFTDAFVVKMVTGVRRLPALETVTL